MRKLRDDEARADKSHWEGTLYGHWADRFGERLLPRTGPTTFREADEEITCAGVGDHR